MARGFEFLPLGRHVSCGVSPSERQISSTKRKKKTPKSCWDVWKWAKRLPLQVEILQTNVGVTRHVGAIFPCSHLSSRANWRHAAAVDPGAISGSADFHRPIVWLLKAPARLCGKRLLSFPSFISFSSSLQLKKKSAARSSLGAAPEINSEAHHSPLCALFHVWPAWKRWRGGLARTLEGVFFWSLICCTSLFKKKGPSVARKRGTQLNNDERGLCLSAGHSANCSAVSGFVIEVSLGSGRNLRKANTPAVFIHK